MSHKMYLISALHSYISMPKQAKKFILDHSLDESSCESFKSHFFVLFRFLIKIFSITFVLLPL